MPNTNKEPGTLLTQPISMTRNANVRFELIRQIDYWEYNNEEHIAAETAQTLINVLLEQFKLLKQ